jgi:hypothetical protein
MYWMLQALEREPHEELLSQVTGTSSQHQYSHGTAESSPAPGRAPYVGYHLPPYLHS